MTILETAEHPSVDTLSSFSALKDLGSDKLLELARQLVVSTASRGARLLANGSEDSSTFYLLEGKLQLTAADGGVQLMGHDDSSARNPVARLRPSRYEVTAATPVRFLRIEENLLDGLTGNGESVSSIELYEVTEEDAFGDLELENQLTVRLFEDLNADRLLLPSLPDVAIKVGTAVSEEDTDAATVAQIVETDPAITAKLLKAANSARFAGRADVRGVNEAIVRLGLRTTHHLVVTFALRELFRSPSSQLRQKMRDLWEHSCRIAALSHVLANKVGGFDAEFALLAGLVHDIGALAVLAYAGEYSEGQLALADIDATVARLRSRIGGMLLRRWQLAPELAAVAEHAENWMREGSSKPDYIDLVIIAQLQAFDGNGQAPGPVAIESTPAFTKLGLGEVTPDSKLAILDEAAEEVHETEILIGG
jgi:HD-like signal output (HDOD) protein